MTTLNVLREKVETQRFKRQQIDDSRGAAGVDAQGLADALQNVIEGEVRFDDGSRALYATDSSNYRQVPIGVVIPRNVADVERTMELARQFGAPILSRGGGTSLCGQCCNVAVVMDFSKYINRILSIDPVKRLAKVEPGLVLDELRHTAVREHGLNFGPDPETHDHCTLGGMLGNNSCGVHSLMCKNNGLGLRVSDNTHELEVLTYDGLKLTVGATTEDELEGIIRAGGRRGEIYGKLKSLRDKYADRIRTGFPKLERRVSGYNLDELLPENGFNVARALVGTESTCVTILNATLMLIPEPKARSLVIFGYPDAYQAAEHLLQILEFKPTGLEGMDHLLFKFVKEKGDQSANLALLPPGDGFLMVEFEGESKKESDAQARRCMEAIGKANHPPHMKLIDNPQQEKMIWKVREGGLGSTAWVPNMPDTWEGWEDSAVPVPNVSDYLREFRALLDKYDYKAALYGHFGQGCIHTRIPFDLYTAAGLKKYEQFMDEASSLVVKYGGALSGEHGDGQSKAQFLPKMFGDDLVQAFNEFKNIWDPQWKMNPGKVVDPYTITENLRLGTDYNPPKVDTHFGFPDDRHSFGRAALRCVGVGKCRRHGEGTMCPSYMVTREEKHSTRGRARMLWEMMNGEIINDGWKSEEVKESLDLCLACKGCKGDCPVNVDMATYKAEFLSHYYEGRIRPRHAFAFGWIHIWARLASAAPMVVNALTQTPGLRSIAKWMAGMDQRRHIPAFAPQTFQEWFRNRPRPKMTGKTVMLWPDTFNNHFHPETAMAAVEVLEDAGFRVEVPQMDICCGRPLYDYGFLNMARRWLLDIIEKLRPEIQAGLPIVVLEPSCWAVFKDELTNMLPNNEDAKRLQQQCFTFGDFLQKKAPHYRLPKLRRKALLHGHCHQKSLETLNDKTFGKLYNEKAILEEMGMELQMPETGCCGMAGSFGFEEGQHYDVAQACGQRVLLPDVEKLDDQAVLVSDGFSCREMISQSTDRTPLHTAQVIQLARHQDEIGRGRPESHLLRQQRSAQIKAGIKTAAIAAGAVAAVGLLRGRSKGRI
jgi:FAD/FMN-containing dehydrogenase/Fe-S oxidoreductase